MSRVVWLRLRPAGYVHAWLADRPPKVAVCGQRNGSGTTSVYPDGHTRCAACRDIVASLNTAAVSA